MVLMDVEYVDKIKATQAHRDPIMHTKRPPYCLVSAPATGPRKHTYTDHVFINYNFKY